MPRIVSCGDHCCVRSPTTEAKGFASSTGSGPNRWRGRNVSYRYGPLISWAGLCPGNDESAGKRRSTRVRKSGTWLKTALVTAARAAVRVKSTYVHAQFVRIKARRSPKKTILAVAASMLTAVWHMLSDGAALIGVQMATRIDEAATAGKDAARASPTYAVLAIVREPANAGRQAHLVRHPRPDTRRACVRIDASRTRNAQRHARGRSASTTAKPATASFRPARPRHLSSGEATPPLPAGAGQSTLVVTGAGQGGSDRRPSLRLRQSK
ncbi:hypothetical protein J2797_005594 [Paraburkholderia terricola]|nr:hypothetical protein [Paraburkholderia terricola]